MVQKWKHRQDREQSKFVESPTRPTESAVEVVGDFTGDVDATPVGLTFGKLTHFSVTAGTWTPITVSGITGEQVNLAIQSTEDNLATALIEYDNSVATTNGWEVYPGGNISRTIKSSVTIYATAKTGTIALTAEVLAK